MALGICFLGSVRGPHHILLPMAKRHVIFPEVLELWFSLSLLPSAHFLLAMASHLAKPHILGRNAEMFCSTQGDSEVLLSVRQVFPDGASEDLLRAMPPTRLNGTVSSAML